MHRLAVAGRGVSRPVPGGPRRRRSGYVQGEVMKLLGLLFCALLAFPVLSFGQKKEYVELQRDIALLQDQVRSLQTSLNEKLAQLQMLVQQSLDASNKSSTAVAVLDSGIRDRLRDQEKSVAGPVAGVGAKLDQLTEEFRAVKESVGDM